MGALIKINALPAGSQTVPFGVPVELRNADIVGTVTQMWEILSTPKALTSPAEPDPVNFPGWGFNPTTGVYSKAQSNGDVVANTPVIFTPDVSGNYRIRLTSFETVGDPKPTTAVVRIPDFYSLETVPATGEQKELDPIRGWSEARNHAIKALGKRQAQGAYLQAANVSGSPITRGRVVRVTQLTDGHTVVPNVVPGGATVRPEYLASITLADPTLPNVGRYLHAIADMDIGVDGFGWIQIAGVFEGQADVDYSVWVADGDPIYCGVAGVQQVAGTALQVGRALDRNNPGGNAANIQLIGAGGGAGTGAGTILHQSADGDEDWAIGGNDQNIYHRSISPQVLAALGTPNFRIRIHGLCKQLTPLGTELQEGLIFINYEDTGDDFRGDPDGGFAFSFSSSVSLTNREWDPNSTLGPTPGNFDFTSGNIPVQLIQGFITVTIAHELSSQYQGGLLPGGEYGNFGVKNWTLEILPGV